MTKPNEPQDGHRHEFIQRPKGYGERLDSLCGMRGCGLPRRADVHILTTDEAEIHAPQRARVEDPNACLVTSNGQTCSAPKGKSHNFGEPAPQQPAAPERIWIRHDGVPVGVWTSTSLGESVAYVREDIALASAEGAVEVHDNSAFVYANTIKLAIEIIKHESTVEEAIKSLVALAATNSPVASSAPQADPNVSASAQSISEQVALLAPQIYTWGNYDRLCALLKDALIVAERRANTNAIEAIKAKRDEWIASIKSQPHASDAYKADAANELINLLEGKL